MRLQQALEGNFAFENHLSENVAPGSDDLERAANLLYDILNESTRYAYDALEIMINGNPKRVSTLYYECVDLMKKAAIGGDKTAFLSMSVLEDIFRKASPLCLVHMESILDGTSRMVDNARELNQIFENNPYKAEWRQRSERYKKIMSRVGLEPDDADYSDLTQIMDPLLDALTFYSTYAKHSRTYRFRIGPEGNSGAPPAFSAHVCKFRSESELVNDIMFCGKENAVMFAAIEQTYGDTENVFEAWYQGHDNERMSNVMRNERIDRETYLNSVDAYSRVVYLCAKVGGTLYLLPMPYRRESYGGGGEFSDKNKYCYGRRAGYAPYQIFYREPPSAPKDSTFLAIPRRGYLLSELMDADQKVWLPVFLNETFNYFFKNGDIKAEDAYLPEERAISTPDGAGTYRNPVPSGALVPTNTAISTVRLQKEIPDPASVFDKPYMKTLVREFGIAPADLVPYGNLILSGLAKDMINVDTRFRTAYLRLICEKVQILLAQRANAEWQVKERIRRIPDVIQRILSGSCDGFTRIIVNGRKDEKGNVEKTCMADSAPVYNSYHGFTVMWYGDPTRSAPPVVYQVRPKTTEDYAAILGLEPGQLIDPLRLYTELQQFWEDYQHAMPRSLSYRRELQPRDLLQINLCMSKKTYKQVLKKKTENSRNPENPENAKEPEFPEKEEKPDES